MYNKLNRNDAMRFPINGVLSTPAHKVSLVVQSVLGSVEADELKTLDFNVTTSAIMQSLQRLICCVIDCKIELKDSISARNALMLARSVASQVWDDSPLVLKLLSKIGVVRVRKLVAAGFQSVEDLWMLRLTKWSRLCLAIHC